MVKEIKYLNLCQSNQDRTKRLNFSKEKSLMSTRSTIFRETEVGELNMTLSSKLFKQLCFVNQFASFFFRFGKKKLFVIVQHFSDNGQECSFVV